MASARDFANLFGSNPLKPMKLHMRPTAECAVYQ
jgi:hypothetical protein